MEEKDWPMEPGLHLMDCMDGMRKFPDGFFDLGIVDPPYGIRVASHEAGKVVGGGYKAVRRKEDRVRASREPHVRAEALRAL